MATGRTLNMWSRIYVDGYDVSGYTRNIGPLAWGFGEGDDNPVNASLIGKWLGHGEQSPGTLNGIFDNTSDTGIHAVLGTAGVERAVMVAQGIQAAPAAGDPVFAGLFRQNSYVGGVETPCIATVEFGQASNFATSDGYHNYCCPWGVLLHANGAETGVNSSAGIDDGTSDHEPSTDGGFMFYEVLSAAGTVGITATLAVQHATANSSSDFVDLASSGVLTLGTAGVFDNRAHGVVALAKPATVNRYLRWQLTLGTATSVTFVLSFHRNLIV